MGAELESLSGYTLGEKLDEGAMGEVFLAHQDALDRTVVLKVLHKDLAQLSDGDSFQQAALKLTEIHHTGIARLYESGEDQGHFFFAMEYVDGTDLRRLLHKTGILDEDEALNVALGVAEALAHAWDREKIFHRDLRPGHIIIQDDGEPKLIDLGVVQLQDQVNESGEAEGIICMPAYIAPELIVGKEEPDYRVDVYALGAILYQMLTGAEPFASGDPQAQLEGHLKGHLADPRHTNPAVRHSTCQFLRRLMARKPNERCQSWKEVIAGLRCLLKGDYPDNLPSADLNSTIEYDEELAEEQHAKVTQRVMKVSTQRIKMVDKNHIPDDHIEELLYAPKSKAPMFIGIAVLVGIIGAGAFLMQQVNQRNKPDPGPGGSGVVTPTSDPANQALAAANAFATDNADAFNAIIEQYQAVIDGHAGTPAARSAAGKLDAAKKQQKVVVGGILASLKTQSARLISEEKFAEAMGLYTEYNGPHLSATKTAREKRYADILKLKELNDAIKNPDPGGPLVPEPPETGGAELPAEVAAAIDRVKDAWKKEQDEFKELSQILEGKYLKAIDRVRERARGEGELEAVLNADELKKNYEESGSFPTEVPLNTHSRLKAIVTDVVRQAAPLIRSQSNAQSGLKQQIIKQIEDRVSVLTRTDKIDEALALRAYSDKIKALGPSDLEALLAGRVPRSLR